MYEWLKCWPKSTIFELIIQEHAIGHYIYISVVLWKPYIRKLIWNYHKRQTYVIKFLWNFIQNLIWICTHIKKCHYIIKNLTSSQHCIASLTANKKCNLLKLVESLTDSYKIYAPWFLCKLYSLSLSLLEYYV